MTDTSSERSSSRGWQAAGRKAELRIHWVNVGKGQASHIAALELAYEDEADVLCIQEPYTCNDTKTQNHPGYDCYAPTSSWGYGNSAQKEAERPRVLTYVRKEDDLQTQQRQSLGNRNILWIEVNDYLILNIYQQPRREDTLNYVINLSPPTKCVVGGDFNVQHDMFEPG